MMPDMGATARSVGDDWAMDEQKLTCIGLSMQLLLKYQRLELNHRHMSLGEEDGGVKQLQPSRIFADCFYNSS
jgi:hypothetical protein